ncbi:hypothetical protein FN846DRAFT_906576 [Sphaerosporella brunnea]|uniref:Uncharacterized protein n=1 Tax=Sphaerosporella brunnea TaxID=1250544 RepID=A0A5J5EYF1_9PEZI|nr:hypothetical protein FN846DRAFT_906576 [Sphaerosporella brunnea]
MQPVTFTRTAHRMFSTTRTMANATPPSQPLAHLKYLEGTAAEVLGTVFSRCKLRDAGKHIKESAIADMRKAKEIADKKVMAKIAEESPTRLSVEGKTEGLLGKVVGCQGMKERAEAKIKTAQHKVG